MAIERNITLNFPREVTPEQRHKIRNFAEDLYREIEVTGLADMGGLEVADILCGKERNILTVVVPKSKRVLSVRKTVTQLLKDHYLNEICSVEIF